MAESPGPPEPSDQLPEEGPSEQVVDDAAGGQGSAATRESGKKAARQEADVRKGKGQATGNPRNAG